MTGRAADDEQAGPDTGLLKILVCPLTRRPLRYEAVTGELVSNDAGLAYPVHDGVPVLLPDQARRL